MKELLIAIAAGLVENPDAVTATVDEPNEEGVTVYHLHVADDDMGRVIGKQGRIAKAIRTVMRAAANRNNEKIAVEID
ncbi:MAG: KH domain-containing protein [Clostridia bacterium]|nr:KH domain-containing protein [Clostridia bacterium]